MKKKSENKPEQIKNVPNEIYLYCDITNCEPEVDCYDFDSYDHEFTTWSTGKNSETDQKYFHSSIVDALELKVKELEEEVEQLRYELNETKN